MQQMKPGRVIPHLNHSAYWVKKEKFLYYEDIYEDWMVFTVEGGSFYYEIGKAKGTAAFGDLVICPPNITFRRVVITPLTFFVLRMDWRTAGNEDANVPREDLLEIIPTGKISILGTERLTRNYAAMRIAGSLPEPERTIRNNHFLHDIWLMYCDENHLQEVEAEDVVAEQKDPLMQKAHALIHQHAYEPLNLKDVAATIQISPVQLTKKFKATYGVTPIHYLTVLRLEKVKKLLLETTLTIDQISECCGYHNGFYLSRIFARHEKITPSHYRKLHQV